jgi:hypothetical protein
MFLKRKRHILVRSYVLRRNDCESRDPCEQSEAQDHVQLRDTE